MLALIIITCYTLSVLMTVLGEAIVELADFYLQEASMWVPPTTLGTSSLKRKMQDFSISFQIL